MRHRYLLAILIPIVTELRAEAFEVPRNALPSIKHVGSAACSKCHRSIYELFLKSPMGRSLALVSELQSLIRLPATTNIYNHKLNRHFEVSFGERGLAQTMYELKTNGQALFRETHRLAYAVGSGVNGYSFLVQRAGFLFEAPLSFYSRPGRWDLSPGFDLADAGFNRQVTAECLSCHSGRLAPGFEKTGLSETSPFVELSIGCENCHGPGELHVQESSAGVEVSHVTGRNLVHPARLSPRLAEDICMKCHQDGDVRVLQPERSLSDFRPGTWLNDTVAILKVPRAGAEPVNLLQHHTSMKSSRCYQRSGGRLNCFSCHKIHSDAPAQASAFREACLSCHSSVHREESLSPQVSQKSRDNCIGCHMPKRQVATVSHSVLTNHRIPAQAEQPLALAEPSDPGAGGLIHVNRPPDAIGPVLAPVVVLKAMETLATLQPSLRGQYLKLLSQAAQATADHPWVATALARESMKRKTAAADQQAARLLQSALGTGHADPAIFADLSEVLERQGKLRESIQVLDRGLRLNPFSALLHKALALRVLSNNESDRAKEVLEGYCRLFPEDARAREWLEQLKLQLGQL